jgi:hypothetical protein
LLQDPTRLWRNGGERKRERDNWGREREGERERGREGEREQGGKEDVSVGMLRVWRGVLRDSCVRVCEEYVRSM